MVRSSLGVFVAVTLLGGCGSGASSSDSAEQFGKVFEQVTGFPLSEAASHGLSPSVLEILDDAAERGFVTNGDLTEAVNLTISCFDDAGIRSERLGGTDLNGLPGQDYMWWPRAGVTQEPDPVGAACEDQNSFWVQAIYDQQPAATQQRQEWFSRNRQDEAVSCLQSSGLDVPDAADFLWFVEAAKEYFDETGDSTCLEAVLS